jgi:hypothetical protein
MAFFFEQLYIVTWVLSEKGVGTSLPEGNSQEDGNRNLHLRFCGVFNDQTGWSGGRGAPIVY